MSESSKSPPPQAVIGEIINGFRISHAVCAAATLGLADRLTDGPQTTAQLAAAVGADEPSLYRLLRALASVGIFTESDPRSFSQTPLSDALRAGAPGSMHGLAVATGMLHMHAWPELLHSVRTGETAFAKVFGTEIFDHLKRSPAAAAAFDEAMGSYTALVGKALATAYDFSRHATVVDLGGGKGALLAHILPAYPQQRGITFDLDHVTARAQAFLAQQGLGDRCEARAGDFFTEVPAGDVYLLKQILHDWDDERSVAILATIRKVIRPEGRVLVLESVVPEGNTPSPSKFLDLNMLVMTGGRERTEGEYRALYKKAGFELTRVIAAHPSVSAVEARPV